MPAKEKSVRELTDSGHLYVRHIDRYGNGVQRWLLHRYYEPYGQYVESIHHDYYDVNGRMDGWASLLRNQQGQTIYMLVNTSCRGEEQGNLS